MLTKEERYQNDPTFHVLVDVMYVEIAKGNMTPTEVREAAMLATIMYEMRHPRAIFYREKDV